MSNSTDRNTDTRCLYDLSDLISHTMSLPDGGLRTFTHDFVLSVDRGRIVFYASSLSVIVDGRIDLAQLDRELTRAGLPATVAAPALAAAAAAFLEDVDGDRRGRRLPWMFVLNLDGSIRESWSCRAKVWPALVASLQIAAGVR